MMKKRVVPKKELAKLDSFAVVVSSGYMFYTGLIQLHLEGSTSITAKSEAIVCNSVEEAILKARVAFPDNILIDVVSTNIGQEEHFMGAMSLLKDDSVAYEIEA